ncbi:PEP-CTERM sorting domain-containing protein [Desulfobacter sp. UBA2225]|uniref:PEP-CTERM sorting domain-containing protein n=1 Tax=Desulfobacter sp. UBA2225 TaxID=1961413 RepID=UPI00258064F2|nr:PEP-CTERM sorting domain-containing protein [Desulfobacter sp. UBA2225]
MLSKFKIMKSFLVFAFFLMSITFTIAPASAYMLNWGLDPNGGGDSILTVPEYLNLTGTATITNDFTTLTFAETGTFHSFSYGPPTAPLLLDYLTATFQATGTLGTDEFYFDAVPSSLHIYTAGNVEIGVFNLLSGGGGLNADFGPSNGFITANFVAESLAAGYWFASDLTTDLSTYDLESNSPVLTLGFATTNATIVSGTEVYDGSGRLTQFDVGNNGQFRLDIVPEPATFMLFGIGLLGFAAISRKKRA